MKTLSELKTECIVESTCTIEQLIATVTDLRAQVELLHADGAVMRAALESCCFVMASSEKTFSESKVRQAISTDAGRDLLARYREAVKVLGFYADEKNWLDQNFPNGDYLSLALVDKGQEARTLLATVKGGSL